MIKKIETVLNVVHYCLYVADYRVHKFSNRINPFVALGKIPAVRKRFEKQNTTLTEIADRVWTDKRFGFGIMISGATLVILVSFVVWSAYSILNHLLDYPIRFSWLPFFTCVTLAYLICQRLVFHNDKYLVHFKRFAEWTRSDKWRNGVLTLLFVVSSGMLLVWSFQFLGP